MLMFRAVLLIISIKGLKRDGFNLFLQSFQIFGLVKIKFFCGAVSEDSWNWSIIEVQLFFILIE